MTFASGKRPEHGTSPSLMRATKSVPVPAAQRPGHARSRSSQPAPRRRSGPVPPGPYREKGVMPAPLSWISQRSPRGPSTSPRYMAAPSPSCPAKLPNWWPQ